MRPFRIIGKDLWYVVALSVLITRSASAQGEVTELRFAEPDASISETEQTLQSMVRARGISEAYATGGLYLMTHTWATEEHFQRENQNLIDNPFINQTWRFCSIFSSTSSDGRVIMGRNWDNQNVGSVIVSLNHPADGYSSISISRAIDLGFPLNVDLTEIPPDFADRFLLAPFNSMDGINEHGLCVAIAGVRHVVHGEDNTGERIFISYLVRRMLDRAKSTDEAVALAQDYVPFLLDSDSLDGHLLITDASGHSVILEYENDHWLTIPSETSWQVLTNKPMYEVPDEILKERCWRYRSASVSLERSEGKADWMAGLQILRDVKQGGTTWSAIYSPTDRDLYLVVYQDWGTIYHIRAF